MTHRRPSIHASDGAVIQSEVLLRHLWQCRRHLRLYGSVFFKATPWFWSTRYSSAIRAEGCPRACEPSRQRRSASTRCWVTAELPEAGRGRWEGRGPGLKLKETDAWRDGQKRGKYRNIRSINDAAGEPPGERPHQSPCVMQYSVTRRTAIAPLSPNIARHMSAYRVCKRKHGGGFQGCKGWDPLRRNLLLPVCLPPSSPSFPAPTRLNRRLISLVGVAVAGGWRCCSCSNGAPGGTTAEEVQCGGSPAALMGHP